MTKLDPIVVLEKANIAYRQKKVEKLGPEFFTYHAPELLPSIESDQVKSVIEVLCEEFNRQLEERDRRIASLEDLIG